MGRFSISGPEIPITSGAVIALAMTLNELCTNTTKFGALSVPGGRVQIAWSLDETTQRVRLTWTEKGGPAVSAPTPKNILRKRVGRFGDNVKSEGRLAPAPRGGVFIL